MNYSNYTFYYDETFHDRKITIKNGHLNSTLENSFDIYIGIFWGLEAHKVDQFCEELSYIEKKHRAILGLKDDEELKSTTFKKKQFSNGLKSLHKNTFNFYYDVFSLIDKYKTLIHFSTFSKIECFLLSLFSQSDIQYELDEFRGIIIEYLSRFIMVENHSDLLQELVKVDSQKSAEDFKLHLLQTLTQEDSDFILFISAIVSAMDFSSLRYNAVTFPYNFCFEIFTAFLEARNIPINKTNLIVDEETNTLKAASKLPFRSTGQAKSTELIQVRLSDWICGFFGRIMKELCIVSVENRFEIEECWFDIRKEHYELLKLVNSIIDRQSKYAWANGSLGYTDSTLKFLAYFEYFNPFESFDAYSQLSSQEHVANFISLYVSVYNYDKKVKNDILVNQMKLKSSILVALCENLVDYNQENK